MTKDNGGALDGAGIGGDDGDRGAGGMPVARPKGERASEDAGDARQLITTIFLSRMKDVFVAMRAAHTLGLGVTVHNRWVMEEVDTEREEWTESGEWVLDLFTDARHVDG